MLDLKVLSDSRFASLRDGGGRPPNDSESTGQYALNEFKLRGQYFSHNFLHLRDMREVIGFGTLRKKTVPKPADNWVFLCRDAADTSGATYRAAYTASVLPSPLYNLRTQF